MTDLDAFWDFDDPAASEQRFREAAAATSGPDRVVLMTQVVRALGLQERYDEGHVLLDDLHAWDRVAPDETVLRRGRPHRPGATAGCSGRRVRRPRRRRTSRTRRPSPGTAGRPGARGRRPPHAGDPR